MQIQAAGMPWFEADDYEAFRKVLPDRSWHPTFADWQRAAEQNIERLRAQGHVVYKAAVRSQEFVAWCAAGGHKVNSQALSHFGAEFAAKALGASG